jgi:hypothetical protein
LHRDGGHRISYGGEWVVHRVRTSADRGIG